MSMGDLAGIALIILILTGFFLLVGVQIGSMKANIDRMPLIESRLEDTESRLRKLESRSKRD